ncbi:hypothetical protein [Enterococcus sp. DIV0086]|uniref:hypothetical protein n=1 Tax=Enterococcus sp. DIV0086 TaxID=2774655 RepID=UPI003D2DAA91
MNTKILFVFLLTLSIGLSACSKNETKRSEKQQSSSVSVKSSKSSEKEIISKDTTVSKENVIEQNSSNTVENENTDKINTKNLTTEQAISWVKNYLIQQGANPSEAENEFQTQMSDDGYLEILRYSWNPAKTSKTISNIYRVNEQGELQIGNNANLGEPWETISTTYIGD